MTGESGEPEEYFVRVRENDIMYSVFLGQGSKSRGGYMGHCKGKLRRKEEID